MIIPKYYEDLNTLHVNTMPNRAYYIPASESMDTVGERRRCSDRFILLNGDWQFKYYDSIYELKDRFYETAYPAAGFGEIPVPGVWQNYGCDRHQYSNIRYPFPMDPPYVPHDNPCGAYIHRFEYERRMDAPEAYLNFEGVDSCFYVWLNGSFVGYSQVSHSTSEFRVTEYLRDGENVLAVLVLKWCDGSYMESQDNYVKIFYSNHGRLLSYMLRCRTKAIEENLAETSVVRCHRSYMVNVMKINNIRKKGKARYVVLDNSEIKPIPVSKSYFKNFIGKIDRFNALGRGVAEPAEPEVVQTSASASEE